MVLVTLGGEKGVALGFRRLAEMTLCDPLSLLQSGLFVIYGTTMERGRHSQILEQRLNFDGAKSTRIKSSLGLITTSIIIMIILVDNFHWHHISKVPASWVLSFFSGLPTSTLTSSPFRMVMMVITIIIILSILTYYNVHKGTDHLTRTTITISPEPQPFLASVP